MIKKLELNEHKKLLKKTVLSGMVCQIDNVLSLYGKGDYHNGNRFLLNLQDQVKELINEVDSNDF